MRLLTDKAVDTKRVALMLYALQIASSNLKRLHEETQEISKSGDIAQEKSLMKELLEVLQLPETEARTARGRNGRRGRAPKRLRCHPHDQSLRFRPRRITRG